MDDDKEWYLTEKLPRHDEVVAFDADEFITAFLFAMKAASGEAHIEVPATLGFILDEDDPDAGRLQLVDKPVVRIGLALKDRYFDVSRGKYYSAFLRVLALLDLVEGGGLEPWIRPAADGSDRTEIARSVIAAAASVPLNLKGQFDVLELMQRVRQLEAGEA
jgi:hypothetical protein